MNFKILFFCIATLILGCNNANNKDDSDSNHQSALQKKELSINLSHLNYLYKKLVLPNGRDAAIIHIYSNYPDYTYDIEPKEGYTCVDDVARAVILLSEIESETEHLVALTEFILFMQNKNGWFNNFIRKDLTINTTYKTSIAQPDWWSWRALWAMEKALPIIQVQDPNLAERVNSAINILLKNTTTYLSELKQKKKLVKGISIATNLPYESATDQASILLIGLCLHYQRTHDVTLEKPMRQLADGMLKMQITNGLLKGMFLSWENVWHAYGNTQSYALLLTGKLLSEDNYIDAALREIDNFYPHLLDMKFLEMMTISSDDGTAEVLEMKVFPQIAYGVRPIIYAYTEAYMQTGDEKYKDYATEWISWFTGSNIASTKMYNSNTGRCFDGIKSKESINKNSGAESTIEALLSIQAYQSIK